MSEKELIRLYNAPLFVITHVEALLPLVSRIAPANSLGYTTVEDVLTERGWRTVSIALAVAQDSFNEVRLVAGKYPDPTPEHDRLSDLLYHAARLLAVAVATLAGLEKHADPTMAAWGLEELLERLQQEAKEARDVERDVYEYDRTAKQGSEEVADV